MSVQVYSQTKPALFRRAILCSLLLFMGTGLLALQMTQARNGSLLGDRVRLPELGCSLKLPRGFAYDEAGGVPQWQVQTFHNHVSEWAPALFGVWHAEVDEPGGAERIAIKVLGQIHPDAASGHIHTTVVRSENVMIGPYDAIEIWDARSGILVRVSEVDGKGYLALSMASKTPLREWHDIFDRSCRSVISGS